MRVQLILVSGTRRWTKQLVGAEATLGRALGCTVRIPSSMVSRLHCRLRQEGSVLTVEDLESINGTYINGKRIHAPTLVRSGDRLTVGPVTFAIEYELSSPEQPIAEFADVVVVEEITDPVEGTEYVLEEAPPWGIPEPDEPTHKRKRKH